jgi:hypothetical protein
MESLSWIVVPSAVQVIRRLDGDRFAAAFEFKFLAAR